jgi:hypothetical protein
MGKVVPMHKKLIWKVNGGEVVDILTFALCASK